MENFKKIKGFVVLLVDVQIVLKLVKKMSFLIALYYKIIIHFGLKTY